MGGIGLREVMVVLLVAVFVGGAVALYFFFAAAARAATFTSLRTTRRLVPCFWAISVYTFRFVPFGSLPTAQSFQKF